MTSEGVFTFVHTPTANSVIKSETFRLSDIPIMLSVTDKDGVLVQGMTHATVYLTIDGDDLCELCSGLVYRQKSISYPNNNSQDIRPGGGYLTDIESANPDAGDEISHQVPAGQFWHILGITTELVTDATVANRFVSLLVDLPVVGERRFYNGYTHTASLTRRYEWCNVGFNTTTAIGVAIFAPLSTDLWAPPQTSIQTDTLGIVAGDNWGVTKFHIEMFFNPV
jgi:hypothetical protein